MLTRWVCLLCFVLWATAVDGGQQATKPCGSRTTGRCKPAAPAPPLPVPVSCVQGSWYPLSETVSFSAWVTVGDYQERQRTTTTVWARDTLVQPKNGGTACGPSTQTTAETLTETQPLPTQPLPPTDSLPPTDPLPPTPPLPSTGEVPPIPELGNWQAQMTSFGAMHCNQAAIAQTIGSFGVLSEDNVWYYDGTKVYQQMATYTGNPGWYTCAAFTNGAYKSWVLAVTNGLAAPTSELGGWRVFPNGLANDYWRTGDPSSRDAVVRLAQYSAFANSGGSSACGYSRETAYILNAYLTAEEVGAARHPLLPVAADNALQQLRQSFETNQCLVVPFMIGVTMESLIHYYERTGDPRVPPAIENAADRMWASLWQPASQSFAYTTTDPIATPDLSLLIAPAYAWLWQLTGAGRHLDHGDAIFAGGVRGAWLYAGKAFSQNYRWSFDYVKWRSQPPGSIQPLTRY